MFRLKVLGSLSLQVDAGAEPLSLQKKRLALLALVAISEGRGISRDRIQAFLWPESDSAAARHALDQLIYATRRSLGVDPFLASGSDLRLDRDVIGSDLLLFEQAITGEDLATAVSVYEGPLLDGFHLANSREFEAWLDGERARLAGVYEKALGTLACRATASGDHAGAVIWWRKLGLANPLSSRIALEVMRAMDRAGDKSGALHHARSYEQRVGAELGVAPDPAINALEKSLALALGSNSIRPSPVPATPLQRPAVATSPPPASAVRQHNVGRRGIAAVGAVAVVGIVIAGWATRVETRRPQVLNRPNAEALRLYLSGINAWNDRSSDGLDSAVIHFRRTLEIDPSYADAYAGLANAYVMIGYSGYRPADAMFPKAKAAAHRSIQLDSTKAAPFAALGMELTWERKFADAERAFERAIRLDPQYATAHQWYGILLMIVGKRREAVAELKRASELDPLSLQIQNNYATFLGSVGDTAARRRHYQKMVAEEPDSAWVSRNPWLLTNLGAAYAEYGRFDDAIRAAEQAVRILPGHPRAVGALASVYERMGDRKNAEQAYALADTTNPHFPAYRGMWYVTSNKLDSAFLWFDRVEDWAIPVMITLRNMGSPETRKDSRYVALLGKLGMPVLEESSRP
jgi:DNA-binding SARP family transcriptional activator